MIITIVFYLRISSAKSKIKNLFVWKIKIPNIRILRWSFLEKNSQLNKNNRKTWEVWERLDKFEKDLRSLRKITWKTRCFYKKTLNWV